MFFISKCLGKVVYHWYKSLSGVFGKAKMIFVHWKFQTNTRDVIAEQFSEEIEEFERFSIFVGFIDFVVNHCSSLSKR